MHVMIAAPEHGRVWGGIGTYLAQLLPSLASRHTVTVLSGRRAEGADARMRTIPITDGGGVLETYARFQIALRRRMPGLVRDHRPDLLVVHHAQMPDLLVAPRVPVVVTTHTTALGQCRAVWQALRSGPLGSSERTVLSMAPAILPAEGWYWRRARHALFVSRAVRDEVSAAYAPRLRSAATVPNGFGIAGADDASRGDAGDVPERYLLFTGRLLGWKGLGVLLRALARVPDAPPLFVTGSGDVRRWERFAARLGLSRDRVRFLGTVPRPRLYALLAGATAYVFPSFSESCPYALIEAMSFGRPIVATNVPGIADMVEDGSSAVLVPPGDPEALAAGIDRVLHDEALRATIAGRAAETARERFTRERMADETSRYFEEVLAAG